MPSAPLHPHPVIYQPNLFANSKEPLIFLPCSLQAESIALLWPPTELKFSLHYIAISFYIYVFLPVSILHKLLNHRDWVLSNYIFATLSVVLATK